MTTTTKAKPVDADDLIELVHEKHGRNWETTLQIMSRALGYVIVEVIEREGKGREEPYLASEVRAEIAKHLERAMASAWDSAEFQLDIDTDCGAVGASALSWNGTNGPAS